MTGDPGGDDLKALRRELERTADAADATEEMLEIVGIVDAALAVLGVRPIVVGGLAVAYWVPDTYVTADIDVVMPHLHAVDDVLAELGFERSGRYWTLPGREPVLEAPGSTLLFDRDGYSEVQLASGRSILVHDVEEVLLVRLEEFVATGNADVFQQCVWLLGVSAVDRDRLQRRAREQELHVALESLETVSREIGETGRKLEIWEIGDLARALRAPAREAPGRQS